LPDLEIVFKGKPYLEVLLKGRWWARVRARLKKIRIGSKIQ